MNTRQYARDWGSSPSRNQAIIAGFSPSERVLYLLSKNPGTVAATSRYVEPTTQWDGGNALTELRGAFPDLDAIVRGKRILDYGCGDGFQSVALAQQGASFVMGIDIAAQRVEHGKRLAGAMTNVTFGTRADGMFDVAISLNSFEHFPQPEESLRELARAMLPGGKILITFGSPWLSPYGSHMNFFTHFPWVNILFSEKAVFRVRQLYRDDGSVSYSPDMNKMTLKKFRKIIAASRLKVDFLRYTAVKGLPLTGIPGLRELFINRISCVLTT